MRFLIALLIACLAMPALATPRCAPMPPIPMAHGMHGDHGSVPAPSRMPSHECIGCIAPIDGMARLASPVRMDRPEVRQPRDKQELARTKDCPATPPPKRFA